jgi:hypothetical protein
MLRGIPNLGCREPSAVSILFPSAPDHRLSFSVPEGQRDLRSVWLKGRKTMPLRSWIEAHPWAVQACRIVGICIFAVAFLLPACRLRGSGPSISFAGWECAKMAFLAMLTPFGKLEDTMPPIPNLLLVLSGWINLLILVYLLLTLRPRAVTLRRVLALATLVCMGATWIFFAQLHLVPLIGHFLWIAGALLVLAPEVVVRRQQLPSTI